MFLGHFAVAMAAKKAGPKISLGTLFLSVNLVDLIWPLFLLLGLEHVRISPGDTVVTPLDFYDYPITHSLLTNLGWSIAAGLVYGAVKKNLRGMFVVGTAVLSHWILDALTHRPDLPLVPGGETLIGLGLWNSLVGTLVLELVMFAGSVILYTRVTKAANKTGQLAFWSWVVFMVLIYFSNLLGPPPPDEKTLAFVTLGAWLFVPWGYWIDRNRNPRIAEPPSVSKKNET